MTKSIYIVAEEHFAGDLAELSLGSHVWVWLTLHNRVLFEAAVKQEDWNSAHRCGLSGYEGGDDALESLHQNIGAVGEHHDGQAPGGVWEEIWILGFASADLDASRIQSELEAGEITISDEQGLAVIRQSRNPSKQPGEVHPDRSGYSALLQKLAFGWKRFSGRWRITDKKCPECGGFLYWRTTACASGSAGGLRCYPGTEFTCLRCDRLTVREPSVPDNDSPIEIVRPYLIDEKDRQWITCPGCSWSFPIGTNAIVDGCHSTCGQRLTVLPQQGASQNTVS